MIHIFNRAELMLTPSVEELARIRGALEANHIEYSIKIRMPRGISAARGGRSGMLPGANPISETMYKIYVRREDLEYAAHFI